MCPQDWCEEDSKSHEKGPWNYAQTAYVVGSQMGTFLADFDNIQSEEWGWGVFYPTDSNAVDKRCRWVESSQLYDCPGGYIPWGGDFVKDDSYRGTGYYGAGNPRAGPDMGGGAGCHFENSGSWGIDQTDAWDSNGENLVGTLDCECNYKLKGDDGSWAPWVWNWIENAQHKPEHNYGFLGGNGKAPSWALDVGMCWVNNFRDVINIQNQIYWNRFDWHAQQVPNSNWNWNDPSSNRPYWGWNEIPMPAEKIRRAHNWDAIVIKLPAAICGDNGGQDTVDCLGKAQKDQLHKDLIAWKDAGHLLPGEDMITQRPGSYVVFAREWMDDYGNWFRYFFCENFKRGNSGVQIVYSPKGGKYGDTGACYADYIHDSETV